MEKFYKELKRSYKNLYYFLRGKRHATPFTKGYLNSPGWDSYKKSLGYGVYTIFIGGIILGVLVGIPLVALLSIIFGSYTLFIILTPIFLFPYAIEKMNNYLLGYRGERVVAGALEECFRKREWRLFHSLHFPSRKSNVDHVVVCQKGIFCVETKANRWTKGKKEIAVQGEKIRLDGELIFGDPIRQATENARLLEDFLQKNTSSKVAFNVFPVVLLADEEKSNYYFSDNLIVGKSGDIKDIFITFADKPNVLSQEQINEIGKTLADINRVSIDD